MRCIWYPEDLCCFEIHFFFLLDRFLFEVALRWRVIGVCLPCVGHARLGGLRYFDY